MSAQFTEAFKRVIFGGVFVGALTVLTTYQMEADWKRGLVAGGNSLMGYVIARSGFEGGIDTGRTQRGDVIPSDVR